MYTVTWMTTPADSVYTVNVGLYCQYYGLVETLVSTFPNNGALAFQVVVRDI